METSRGATSARERILAAAADEFATFGVAGARTDRIARNAKTSKERVYAYFRSKDELYRCVAEHELAVITDAVNLDPSDLPAYAGRVHDYFLERPDHLRLMQWGMLAEGGADTADPFRTALRLSVQDDVARVRAAQEMGLLDASWDPIDVVVLVNNIAIAWSPHLDFADLDKDQTGDAALANRRAAIVAAVAAVFPPAAARPGAGHAVHTVGVAAE